MLISDRPRLAFLVIVGLAFCPDRRGNFRRDKRRSTFTGFVDRLCHSTGCCCQEQHHAHQSLQTPGACRRPAFQLRSDVQRFQRTIGAYPDDRHDHCPCTLAIIVGGNSPGQEIEHPMALVILGGLVSSTLLNFWSCRCYTGSSGGHLNLGTIKRIDFPKSKFPNTIYR